MSWMVWAAVAAFALWSGGKGRSPASAVTGNLRVRLADDRVVNGRNRRPDPSDLDLELVEVWDLALVPPAWRTVRVSSAQIFDTPAPSR